MVSDAVLKAAIEKGIKATFDLDTPDIKLEDLTNYQTLGVDIAGDDTVKGIFSVKSPVSAILYQNSGWGTSYASPDIDINASDTEKDGITFPLDDNSKPLQGTYVINYNVQVVYGATGGSPTTQILNIQVSREYCVNLPKPGIDISVDCLCSKLVSTDNTTLVIDSVTPSVVRTHTVTYPAGVVADEVATTKQVIISPLYTGTFTTILKLVLTYDFGTVVIVGTVSDSLEKPVECPTKLCDLYCCVVQTYKRWRNIIAKNRTKAEEYGRIFDRTLALVHLYQLSGTCSVSVDQEAIYNDVLNIAECSPGCGCESGKPQLIVPLCGTVSSGSGGGGGSGSGGTTEIVEAGAGISVTVGVGGGATTYTVAIDPAVLAAINAATDTILSTNTPSLIDLTDLGDGDWRIDYIGDKNDFLDFEIALIMLSASTFNLSINNQHIYGDRYKTPTVEPFPNNPILAGGNLDAIFSINSFLNTPYNSDSLKDKAKVSIITGTGLIFPSLGGNVGLDVRVRTNGHNSITFVLTDQTMLWLTYAQAANINQGIGIHCLITGAG